MTENKLEKSSLIGRLSLFPFLKSRLFIALAFTLVGVLITITSQIIVKYTEDSKYKLNNYWLASNLINNHNESFRDLRSDPFLVSDSIFEEIDAHQKRLNEVFKSNQQQIMEAFKKAEAVQGKAASVSMDEDSGNYYYQLSFSGFKKDEIIVSVDKNILKFFSKSREENGNKSKNQQESSLYYVFSIPEWNHSKEPEILREDNRIIVRIAKKVK